MANPGYRKKHNSIKGLYILMLLFVVVLTIGVVRNLNFTKAESSSHPTEQSDKSLSEAGEAVDPNQAVFRIVIDAGHGGSDPGATGASGAYEKEFNLSLAKRVSQLLDQDPMFEVRLTREEDQFIELEDRAAFANDWKADVLVSIHGNTYEDKKVSGTETLYTNDDSILLAQLLQEQVVSALGTRDRGVKQDQLVVLSLAQMPAVIVEVGYLTNKKEEKSIVSRDGQDLAANAIFEGIKKYVSQRTPRSEDDPLSDDTSSDDTSAAANKIYFSGKSEDGKQVALTFDDGPDEIVTPKILDVLKEHNVKATFFILGNRANTHPDIVKRIVDEGHAIGNHSWSHPNFDNISMEEALKEVEDTQSLLESTIGYRPSLFRPPYGALKQDKLDQLSQMNLAVVNWTVDTMDWSGVSSEEIIGLVREQLYPGGIVLQHTANGKNHLANTIEALKQMIPELSEDGYSFVTVPELLNLPDSQTE